MAQTASVKSFLLDKVPTVQTEEKKKVRRVKSTPKYDVILQNDLDFVLEKKTPTTHRTLVFLVSQSTFYLKDNKTDKVEGLDERKIRFFFREQLSTNMKFFLDKVSWWNGSPECMLGKMVDLIESPTVREMYKHGVPVVNRSKAAQWRAHFENNTKLFKYCYDKISKSRHNGSLDTIIKIATDIEKTVNYNNAKYFIDKLCESQMGIGIYNTYISDIERMVRIPIIYNLDFNRYIDYLLFDLYTQGITILNSNLINDYEDYLRMQVELYGKVKEKYTEFFRTEHDKIALKLVTYDRLKKDLQLLNVAEKFKDLEYEDDTYRILLPKTSAEIVDEGINQSHCVGSYVDRVAKEETLIVFMRSVTEPEKSLVTIEVCNGTVKQARGYANRCTTEEENKFIESWAKEKELVYNRGGQNVLQ